ncbi:hypothetical protein E2C01_017740 [Portunus trituberculatus]|uniref:Uncharacterized protein n=1 Tax=Portunus trituberculatus TaxID=210409 RepID=A0A5B7DUM4_PORTR|nr:hypothetical protein [Portunus trituberculatus]
MERRTPSQLKKPAPSLLSPMCPIAHIATFSWKISCGVEINRHEDEGRTHLIVTGLIQHLQRCQGHNTALIIQLPHQKLHPPLGKPLSAHPDEGTQQLSAIQTCRLLAPSQDLC